MHCCKTSFLDWTKLISLLIFVGLLAIPAIVIADTLSVPLPGLIGPYSLGTTRVAAFDLGITLDSISSVSLQWSGTLHSGVGQGDGVEMPLGDPFDWPTQISAYMDPEGYGMWSVSAGPYNGPFNHEGTFTSYLNLTWDFIHDGVGEVRAALSPLIIIGGIMLQPPYGEINSAQLVIVAEPRCCNIRADIDHDGADINIADLTYLIDYMFRSGPEPPCHKEADVNADEEFVDIADLVFLIDYMFRGGPAPAPCIGEYRVVCPPDTIIPIFCPSHPDSLGLWPTVEHSCMAEPFVFWTDSMLMGGIRRFWMASDTCGNADTCMQAIGLGAPGPGD